MRTLVASAVLALALVGCGGRSAACTKALNCGTAVTGIGAASAETAVKACEQGGAATDACCGLLTTSYTAAGTVGGATAPAACTAN